VASSAGNHAQGVAYAAHRFGIPATIVMPKTAPIAKAKATVVQHALEPLCRAFKFLQWDLHSKHPRKNICLGLSVPTIPREGRKYKRRNAKCPRQKNFFERSSAG